MCVPRTAFFFSPIIARQKKKKNDAGGGISRYCIRCCTDLFCVNFLKSCSYVRFYLIYVNFFLFWVSFVLHCLQGTTSYRAYTLNEGSDIYKQTSSGLAFAPVLLWLQKVLVQYPTLSSMLEYWFSRGVAVCVVFISRRYRAVCVSTSCAVAELSNRGIPS